VIIWRCRIIVWFRKMVRLWPELWWSLVKFKVWTSYVEMLKDILLK
jgi:hypothetical protein